MPDLSPNGTPPRRRMRWQWRLLTLKVYVLSIFLLACMLGGCAMLFLNVLNDDLDRGQRLGSFIAGALILLLCIHILRLSLPPLSLSRLWRRRGLE